MEKRWIVATALALLAVPVLAACSGTPADPVASARELDGAPRWVRVVTGTDCGQVAVDSHGALPAGALECLDRVARDGWTGTLTWVARTTEGDPVPFFVRVDGGAVEVASTTAYDSYGRGGWTESTCSEVAALPACR